MRLRSLGSLALCAALAGCGFFNDSPFYQNDGPPSDHVVNDTGAVNAQGAIPRVEPFFKASLKPYTVMGERYVPVTTDTKIVQTGVASWYGKQFHGNKTSTGETYDMYAMSAAHTTMPLPSYARVTNLENGKSIIVRVNDRGPFLHSRIIDLSYAAAKALGYVDKGTAKVRVERLTFAEIRGEGGSTVSAKPVPTPSAPVITTEGNGRGWGVQIGAFGDLENARAYASHAEAVLASRGEAQTVRVVADGSRWRVIVAKDLTEKSARALAASVKSLLGTDAFIIRR